MFRFFIPLALASMLSACASSISPEVLANADYGPPPPPNHQELIKADFATTLIDPTAPIYRFDPPKKGYTAGSRMHGTEQAFGWTVCGTVNSKNRFGGYVGSVPFFVLFRDDQIVFRRIGEVATNNYNFSIDNSAITNSCNRSVG